MDDLVGIVRSAQEVEPAAKEFAAAVGQSGPIQEFVTWITDEIRYRREPRKAALLKSAASKIRSSGLPAAAVSDRVLRVVLEEGSFEEDAQMQDRWANLLANAATGLAAPPVMPEILRQIEPIEARLLESMTSLVREGIIGHVDRLPHALVVTDPDVRWRHLENLERLHLIQFVSDARRRFGIDEPPEGVRYGCTALALEFISACTAPKMSSGPTRDPG